MSANLESLRKRNKKRIRRFKGGGTAPANQTVTQTNIAPWAEPTAVRSLERAEYESLQGYQPYSGQRLADFNPMETQAQSGIASLDRPYQQGLASATAADLTTTGMPNDPGKFYSAGTLGASGTFNDPAAAYYMSPYQSRVTDVAANEMRRQAAISERDMGLQAAQSGGLGGYRDAIRRAELDRNLMTGIGDLYARGSQDAFENAQQQFERDRAARQGYFESQEGANQQEGQLGLGTYEAYNRLLQGAQGQQLGAAQLLGNLGAQEQAMELERLQQQEAAGQRQRGLEQASLDIGYGDFQNQRNFTQDQLSWLSSILQGTPIPRSTTQSTFEQQPGALQSALGTGIGALGLYNAWGGQGGGGP